MALAPQNAPNLADRLWHRQVFRLNTALLRSSLYGCQVIGASKIGFENGPAVAYAREGWVDAEVGCCKRSCLRLMARLSQRGNC